MNCSDISVCNGKVSKEPCGSPSPSPQASVASTQEDGNVRIVRLPSGCSTPSQEPQRLHDGPSRLSTLDGSNLASSPCTSETGLETEEMIHMHTSCPLKSQEYHDLSNTVSSSTVIVPQHQSSSANAPAVALTRTGNPVNFKSLISHPTRSSPYRLPVYSNVRFRARNMKKQQEQQVNLTKTFQQVNSINSTNITDAEWINDEEMLFARFVGLRLKKMNSHYRSMVCFAELSLFFLRFFRMSIQRNFLPSTIFHILNDLFLQARMKIMQVLDSYEEGMIVEDE